MALEVGSRLGHYTVDALIGEGGMGQVYQATDTKLNRQVALKILPEAFASDPDRLARFQREAQVLASLNHPNIGQIHGIEDSEGTKALVLELVEGPTLADRIAQGPIPVDEALPIAKQIAEALEAAHEQGVIHRDLKPANIKLKPDGAVKVLDFGLAKALDTTPEGDPSQSPTLTAAATQMGVIMGTAAYMSPEQARGTPVDRRADVWAIGCVLYEMLTGKKAFEGEDVSLTLSAVLQSEPEWATLPQGLSPVLRTYLRRCLEKEPRRRIRDIGDVRLAMEGAFEIPAQLADEGDDEEVLAAEPGPGTWRGRHVVAAAMLGAAVVFWAGTSLWSPTSSDQSYRLTVTLPEEQQLAGAFPLALSPDGTRLVYAARIGARSKLYLRPLEQFEASEIPGTDDGIGPFFSPDGQWVGFVANGQMKKVSLAGALPLTVADGLTEVLGASWGTDGTIVYTPSVNSGLMAVSANGGQPRQLTDPDFSDGGYSHVHPQHLPDGEHVLFTIFQPGGHSTAVLSLTTGEWHRVLTNASGGFYLPTGHLTFQSFGAQAQLLAQPFDLSSLSMLGGPVAVLSDASMTLGLGRHAFTVSPDGRWIAYVSDESGRPEVYVRPFPGVSSPQRLISDNGGEDPRWGRDGGELFYRAPEGVMAVSVDTDSGFERGVPTLLFRDVYHRGTGGNWDVSCDGRFLMVKGDAEAAPQQITVVLNWFSELKARVPTN